MRKLRLLFGFFYFGLICTGISACEPIDLWDEIEDGKSYDAIDINAVRKRAQQIANIRWKAQGDIPRKSGYFAAGGTYTGIPYSSVKELDKFVGFDVSFHTFMTAVNNPRSVLYTENISKPPYHGTNCATYYGTVCSATVSYALGINFPWATSQINECGLFKEVPKYNLQSLRVADVIWKSGHEVLVYDILRDNQDSLLHVSLLESIGNGTSIREFDKTAFMEWWKSADWHIYRYTGAKISRPYNSIPFYAAEGEFIEPYEYNTVLCPSLGDRAVYREGDDVVINILDDSFSNLLIYKDDQIYDDVVIESKDIVFSDFKYGTYSVTAYNDSKTSKPIEFQVINTNVELLDDGTYITIRFDSKNATPVFAEICGLDGSRYLPHELTPSELRDKTCTLKKTTHANKFIKVFFETPWGRITNTPISIN